jgi:hypothetical protein
MIYSNRFLDEASHFLLEVGYDEAHLVPEYAYSWRSEPGRLARGRADLVAFSGRPYSLQTACVAVVAGRPIAEARDELNRLRYLAVPAAILLHDQSVQFWGLKKELPAKPILESSRSSWQQEFRSQIGDLSPASVRAAKRGDRQLSFVDVGFTEWAEAIAEQTLAGILESLIEDSLDLLPPTQRDNDSAEKAILRLVCHLFACRVLEDKGIIPRSESPEGILRVGSKQFPENIDPAVLDSPYVSDRSVSMVYERLKERFVFDSLTTEILGYAYENAMVTPQLRKQLGIYYTPRAIAEYILDRLPLESIEPDDIYLCDPCCGSGSFLLAAFDRVSQLPRKTMTPVQRHVFLKERLIGTDKDWFACEMAKLSLVLTDPYNRDGWQVRQIDDVLTHEFSKEPTVIVTNPKFKEQKEAGQRREFAAEVLKRIIEVVRPGGLIGIVLPQSILDSRVMGETRRTVLEQCEVLEIALFPGGIFNSGADTVVLLLRRREGPAELRPQPVTVRELRATHLSFFMQEYTAKRLHSFTRTYPVDSAFWILDKRHRFIVSPLMELWTRLESRCKTLKDYAQLATGCQVDKTDKTSVRNIKLSDSDKPYVDRLDVLRPFVLLTSHKLKELHWLDYGPHLRRMADEELFKRPKVLINATRNPGSAWRLVAAMARGTLYFSDNFHGIRPEDPNVTLEVLAAVLNNSVANAWFDSHCRSRKVVLDDLRRLPFPSFGPDTSAELTDLVKSLERSLASKWRRAREWLFYDGLSEDVDAVPLLAQIDSLVCEAYGLGEEDRRQIDALMSIEKRPT